MVFLHIWFLCFIPEIWGKYNSFFAYLWNKTKCFKIPHAMAVQFIYLHGFSFTLPGVAEYVEPVWLTAWHPAAPFPAAAWPRRCSDCLIFVFIWQRYHYHPNFQTICQQWPMPGCRSHFSFFYYDPLFDPHLLVKMIESIMIVDFFHTLDKSLMWTSASWRSIIPHHFVKMFRMFCVL